MKLWNELRDLEKISASERFLTRASPSLKMLTQSDAWVFMKGRMCRGSVYELNSLRGARIELGVVCKVGGCGDVSGERCGESIVEES